jgi:ribonucleoside-diphosphate reductase alpha subunit
MANMQPPFLEQEMRVTKRDGTLQDIQFDKILTRVKKIGQQANVTINFSALVMKIIDQLYDGIPTTKIDELTAQQCATQSSQHPDYGTLASYIIISNHHKNTDPSFVSVMKRLYEFKDKSNNHTPLISETTWNIIRNNSEFLEKTVSEHSKNDFYFDYFGFKTLERAYLMRINGVVQERPQYMWMRVSIGIHGDDMKKVYNTFVLMSEKYFTHATPTLFNAGTQRPQLSSCYLIAMENDSLDGIFNTLKECANISKWAGGIGLHIHNIRAAGSLIRGTNGMSTGIVPMLRVFNNTARYIDQGGRRNGSFAIYLEPWHSDVLDFLELKKNQGDEETKARDLFYSLWIPDLFMEKIKTNEDWCLFCPDECPGLSDVCGAEFKKLYETYESQGKYKRKIKSRDLWFKILDSQMETGTPYLCYKDASNMKSNQKNLGVIKSSNLCTEIIQYSNKDETAVCNLASIALNRFVVVNPDNNKPYFDYNKLHTVVRVVTQNLNRVIDVNYYPTEKTRVSNMRHRPIGIGVQGLADVFFMMNIAFYSEDALNINRMIFETIYHAALTESNEISRERAIYFASNPQVTHADASNNSQTHTNHKFILTKEEEQKLKHKPDLLGSYSSFIGSPTSEGIFQFDMWNVQPIPGRYDWAHLRKQIIQYGLRNSLLVAPMPTASTSQILGNNECFEPITSNIYMRRTLAGEFIMINKYLINEFLELGIWNEKIKNNIIANRGSIQQLTNIPGLTDHIKNKYKTVWEIPMKHLIDMSAERGAFICQSQSLNLWLEEPNYNTLTSMHFYAWSRGLKTGIYYLRRKPKHQAQQFTIEPENHSSDKNKDIVNDDNEFNSYVQGNSHNTSNPSTITNSDDNVCEMCSS